MGKKEERVFGRNQFDFGSSRNSYTIFSMVLAFFILRIRLQHTKTYICVEVLIELKNSIKVREHMVMPLILK